MQRIRLAFLVFPSSERFVLIITSGHPTPASMLGTRLRFPKWLLPFLVFGVLIGQLHQLMCKPAGDHATTSSSICTTLNLSAGDDDGTDNDCPFDCHAAISTACVLTPYEMPVPVRRADLMRPGSEPAPLARRESVDYPPQLA